MWLFSHILLTSMSWKEAQNKELAVGYKLCQQAGAKRKKIKGTGILKNVRKSL